jgi:hypothetical protein
MGVDGTGMNKESGLARYLHEFSESGHYASKWELCQSGSGSVDELSS